MSLIAFVSLGLLTALNAPAGSGEIVTECGLVYERGDCRVLYPYWPTTYGAYVLPDSPYVAVGAECSITGEVRSCGYTCQGLGYPVCLIDIEVKPCAYENLGCGVLYLFSEENHCYTWTPLGNPSGIILVDDLGGFAAGDTVNAQGIRAAYPDICICGCGVLLHARFAACGDTLTSVYPVTWGRLKALFRK